MSKAASHDTMRYKPTTLAQALSGYLLWTRELLKLMEAIAAESKPNLPKNSIWAPKPKPNGDRIVTHLKDYPVPPEAVAFDLIHRLRAERYDAAYKLADSEKKRTDDPRAPLAEKWSTRLRTALITSAVGIRGMFGVPEELPQMYTLLSRNRDARERVRRGILEVERFLAVLVVLNSGGQVPGEPDHSDTTVDRAEKYLVGHEGAPGDEVAEAIGVTWEHFRSDIVPKLKDRGWGNDRRTGYRRHKRTM
ncbi:MAG: hypothetical protein ABSC42_15505 [Tepidisphaeraceae bacterium]|jgi:hypothetical protein